MKGAITKSDLLKKIKVIGVIEKEKRNSLICALIGHSRIMTVFFGYHYCGRCDAQIGDTLGGFFPASAKAVIVGHNCDTCRDNFKTLTWRDKFESPDPFKEPK